MNESSVTNKSTNVLELEKAIHSSDEETQDPSNDAIVSIHDEKQPIPEENVPQNKESVENEEILPIPVKKGPIPSAVDVSNELEKNGHDSNEKIPIPVNGSENSGPNNLDDEKAKHLQIKEKLPIPEQVKENLTIPVNVSDGPNSVDEDKATQVEVKDKLPIPNNASENNGLDDEKTEHVQVNEKLPIPEQVESPSTTVNTSLATVEASSNNDPSSVTEKTQTITKPKKVKPIKLPKLFLCREYDHKNKKNWVKMEDPRWCDPRCRFYNTYCYECQDFFVASKPKEKNFRPSSRKPMYCCKNWTDNCQFALCYGCFVKAYTT